MSRRRYRRHVFAIAPLLFALVQLSLPTMASAAPMPGVKVKSGVTYTTDGGKPQLLDVYSPSKPGTNMRAVIFVHGGGWTGGSRAEWAQDAMSLAAAGWVAVTVDYRTDSATPYISEPQDIRAAVTWLQKNAHGYGVDPARIALVGSSAGGHLAALEATNGTGKPGAPGRVKAVVSWSGPMDMALLTAEYGCVDHPCSTTTQWAAAQAQSFEGGCLPASCPDRWTSTSPIDQVDPTDPATLLVNSTTEMVPVEQLNVMAQQLASAGVPVSTQVLDGSAHASAYHDVAWPGTLAFLQATV